jgi:hypothetical protein
MKYRNRPKSAGNFTLSFAIQSLARLENINYDLFFNGREVVKSSASFQNCTPTDRRSWRSAKQVEAAKAAYLAVCSPLTEQRRRAGKPDRGSPMQR